MPIRNRKSAAVLSRYMRLMLTSWIQAREHEHKRHRDPSACLVQKEKDNRDVPSVRFPRSLRRRPGATRAQQPCSVKSSIDRKTKSELTYPQRGQFELISEPLELCFFESSRACARISWSHNFWAFVLKSSGLIATRRFAWSVCDRTACCISGFPRKLT